jgi:hypothetical protein
MQKKKSSKPRHTSEGWYPVKVQYPVNKLSETTLHFIAC